MDRNEMPESLRQVYEPKMLLALHGLLHSRPCDWGITPNECFLDGNFPNYMAECSSLLPMLKLIAHSAARAAVFFSSVLQRRNRSSLGKLQ